jgi:hypothetical protein
MKDMFRGIIFNHWQAKLISFAVATGLWLVLKHQIDPAFMDQLLTGTISQ